MKNWRMIPLLAALLTLAACTSVQYLSVDSLVPAGVSLPSTVRKVAVVNNVVPGTVRTHQAVTVGETMAGSGRLVAETLSGCMADARYFDQVILSDSSRRSGEGTHRPEVIPATEVGALLAGLGADALVSVDKVTFTNRQQRYYQYDGSVPGIATTLKVTTRLYLPGREGAVHVFHDTDSVLNALDGLTDLYLAKLVSEVAGALPLSHLIPQWEQEDRYYYTSGAYEMRDAGVAVREGDWQSAGALWQQVYDRKPKGKTRMRAAFNLAFYHEVQGDMATAWRYIQEAAEMAGVSLADVRKPVAYHPADDRRLIRAYAHDLFVKLEAQTKLEEQMYRVNEEK